MTGDDTRDIEPPAGSWTPHPPEALYLGYDLENLLCAYCEATITLSRGFPPAVVNQIRRLGHWAVSRLQALGVTPALVRRFERRLDDLPSREQFQRLTSDQWSATIQDVPGEIEELFDKVRTAMGTDGLRYFSFGILLCRLQICSGIMRTLTEMPVPAAVATYPLRLTYHRELVRLVAVLAQRVEDDTNWPRDPQQADLDRAYDEFIDYVPRWIAAGAPIAEEFHQQVARLAEVSGIRRTGTAEQQTTWTSYPDLVAEEQVTPLPVPHTPEDRSRLESDFAAIPPSPGPSDAEHRRDELQRLLRSCRRTLGPVHDLTLRVQTALASTYLPTGQGDVAAGMLRDIVNTVVTHYADLHATRYVLVDHVCHWLGHTDPVAAGEIRELVLGRITSLDNEDEVPPSLREVWALLRRPEG
ncbi:hypothetical protein B0I31_11595 [Saccharothrix carnea]|uniref:Uncharacterized protein n=1 Tax=Saccharothrix carnea TaxID=1280637 RepID=A0A2P8I139_SACCR|nr:hypothetical protein [Saccharothrix carnea]PSL52143.1 hypothetical protein B0I31_11595 [Saccharothrix carnea]